MTENISESKKISLNNENKTNGIKTISLLKLIPKFKKQKKKVNKQLLGTKRKLFKKISKKEKTKLNILSINHQENFSINKIPNSKKNLNQNENDSCIICFEKILFQDKHYLHCGHCFHCDCIKKWLDCDKNNCPMCKRDIDCEKILDNTISLEESDDEEENVIVFDNNINDNDEININNGIINNRDIDVFLNRRRINIENRRQIKFMLGMYICIMIFYILTYLIKNGFLYMFEKHF